MDCNIRPQNAMQDCDGSEHPDLYYDQEDGSGRQIFTLEPVSSAPGQFYIIARDRFRGTPYSCNAYLSAAACSSDPSPDPSISYTHGDDGMRCKIIFLCKRSFPWQAFQVPKGTNNLKYRSPTLHSLWCSFALLAFAKYGHGSRMHILR